jgi:uncharacterized membrane protein
VVLPKLGEAVLRNFHSSASAPALEVHMNGRRSAFPLGGLIEEGEAFRRLVAEPRLDGASSFAPVETHHGKATHRLETFCDGVFGIALTLLIIDIKVPAGASIGTSRDLWRALGHLLPSVFAFVLSFGSILIAWVNHHALFKRIHGSSVAFVYANGFLLLTVVFLPFPTALLGETIGTDHASPAVVLYCVTIALQSVGWYCLGRTALAPEPLTRSERATEAVRDSATAGLWSFAFYAACAIAAVWIPLAVAAVITLVWVFWTIYGHKLDRK